MNFNLRRSMKTKSPPPQASSGSNSVVSDSLIQKWSCSMCTYENWPKSVKCSMCYTHRPTSLFTSSSTSSVGEQPKNSGHRLTESIERLSLTPRGQAEASGGIVIEEEVRGHQVLNDDHRSGFSSDSDEGEGQEGTQRLSSSSHRLRWGGRIIRRQMKDSFNSPSSSSPQIESITITIDYFYRQKVKIEEKSWSHNHYYHFLSWRTRRNEMRTPTRDSHHIASHHTTISTWRINLHSIDSHKAR